MENTPTKPYQFLSGNGLKDVANAIAACGEPISIPGDMDRLLRAFEENGIVVE